MRGLGAVFVGGAVLVALLAVLIVPAWARARARVTAIRLEGAREARRRGGGGQAAGERW
ncbi:hypothetical protein LUW75_17930 [Streptomyces sp. MRC013]|uniref:hypothetical protein n=1 Tax=Streptomyces sp. MRC013 TaxID=2898276 RepID=UPI0020271314|nr:hypothetical protein [Streptomyces sp. MRC013]URM91543.1 hypothetical protein LUW75_17930 [Streptomyces sp. MRC013]